jgi:membrane-associated phospholipid phosphatase
VTSRTVAAAVAVTFVLAILAPAVARAEPWYEGARGHHRVVHLTAMGLAAVTYVASETFLKPSLAASTCRWCVPDGLDRDLRNDLVWSNPSQAGLYSNLTGYAAAPLAALGLTALEDLEDGGDFGVVLDHTLPILETLAYSQLVVQAIKFSVGRARPEVAFGRTAFTSTDDNTSFVSGHSAMTFALAVGAGMVAHQRHARYEKWIWGAGLTLAATTAYLRIGADKHYASDVVAGGAIGVAAGIVIPGLVAPATEAGGVVVVPTGNGLAISGTF